MEILIKSLSFFPDTCIDLLNITNWGIDHGYEPENIFLGQLLIIILILISSENILAGEVEYANDLFGLSIEELLNIDVSVASKKSESLSDAPGIVSVVPREEIEIYGDRNLSQLMQRQTSVYTLYTFSYGNGIASFRGDMPDYSDKHNLILLNGRPVRESAIGYNYPLYMAFPLRSLDNVELIRGPGSVLYGSNAFTGVINLNSREIPDSDEVSIFSMGGSYGYHDTTVSLGGKRDDLGYTIDMRVAGQDGWPYFFTDSTSVYDNKSARDQIYSINSHIEYHDLTFDIFATEMETFTMGAYPNWSSPYHENDVKRLFMNLGYRIPIHDRVSLELNTTYNLQEDRLAAGDHLSGTNAYDILGEATLFVNPFDNMNLVFGFLQEYRRNYKPDNDTVQTIPSYNYEHKSAYAQGDYKIGDFAKLILDTQWNESPTGDSDFVNRYGIILTPHKNWGIKLLRGEAFRGTTAIETDLYDNTAFLPISGNKNLKPETITTYDAQLFFKNKTTNAAITYFQSKTNGTIIFDFSGGAITFKNGGEQKFNGIEFEVKHFLSPQWHILSSYMHQEQDVDASLNECQTPSDMAKLGIGYTWKGGSASIFHSYFSAPVPTPTSSTLYNPKPESINLLSMNVRLDISKWFNTPKNKTALIFKAENLLDEDTYVPIVSSDTYPYGPGTTFYAGLQMKF